MKKPQEIYLYILRRQGSRWHVFDLALGEDGTEWGSETHAFRSHARAVNWCKRYQRRGKGTTMPIEAWEVRP